MSPPVPENGRVNPALDTDHGLIADGVRAVCSSFDDAFWRARLDTAIRFRDTLQINATAFRLVHGEADLLPSLIVDRYGDYLVVHTLSQGMDRLLPQIVDLRHDEGRHLRDPEEIRRVLTDNGVDAEAVFGEIATGGPLATIRDEHTTAAQDNEMWGVPTFVHGDQ